MSKYNHVNKELAKTDFINSFSKLPPIDLESLGSVFTYMRSLDVLLEDLYNTGFNDGFSKAVDLDVKKS